MSFFRAGSAEDTSNSYDESRPSSSHSDRVATDNGRRDQFETLSRNDTLDSDNHSGNGGTAITLPSILDQEVRQDALLHALLEENCLLDALAELQQTGQTFSKNDPEVKARAEVKYQILYDFLRGRNMITPKSKRPEQSQMRDTIRKGLDFLSNRSHALDQPNLRHGATGSTALALYSNPPSRSSTPAGFQRMFQKMSLRNSEILLDHPLFDSSRYGKSFQELGTLGKGGYGKVYHVRHTLDRSDYAVKKVVLNASRVERIRERGQAELDVLLAEIVALARLDHPNIVRYYSSWLEYCAPDIKSTSSQIVSRRAKLLEPPSMSRNTSISNGFSRIFHRREQSFRTERSMSGGSQIIFESSERSDHVEKSSIRRRNRSLDSALQLSPTRRLKPLPSRLAFEQRPSEYEDGTGEKIPESTQEHEVVVQQESSIRTTSESSTEMSEPHLTLHVQMALYPLNLAEYLMPSSPANSTPYLAHCFHLEMSLRVFLEILNGVEYLHKQRMVHRDLKPSNIFMSVQSQAAHKHLDLGACKQCRRGSDSNYGPYLNLRIGDFGLVAELAHPEPATLASPSKAVGTQLYRPPLPERTHKSLDVYALGVIAFELLCPFETRMERHDILQSLRKGNLPENFMSSYGEAGSQIANSIKSMVHSNPDMRPSCEEIRAGIERLILTSADNS